MVSDKKKINRVLEFLKKGLISLSDELGDTVKNINDFVDSLKKAEKDLKGVSVKETVQTVSTSSKQVVTTGSSAKASAASTLFSLLSGGKTSTPAQATASQAPAAGPPKPPSAGPPKAPAAGPPKPPSAGPPKAPAAGPPKAPAAETPKTPAAGTPKAPVTPPKPPAAGPPSAPATPPSPTTSSVEGGGLSSLRDEMLGELDRLKKIMRGE
jgi:hypothetical protein